MPCSKNWGSKNSIKFINTEKWLVITKIQQAVCWWYVPCPPCILSPSKRKFCFVLLKKKKLCLLPLDSDNSSTKWRGQEEGTRVTWTMQAHGQTLFKGWYFAHTVFCICFAFWNNAILILFILATEFFWHPLKCCTRMSTSFTLPWSGPRFQHSPPGGQREMQSESQGDLPSSSSSHWPQHRALRNTDTWGTAYNRRGLSKGTASASGGAHQTLSFPSPPSLLTPVASSPTAASKAAWLRRQGPMASRYLLRNWVEDSSQTSQWGHLRRTLINGRSPFP